MKSIRFGAKCCVCQKVKVSETDWQPEQDTEGSSVIYTHGYCPDCFPRALAEVDDWLCSQAAASAG